MRKADRRHRRPPPPLAPVLALLLQIPCLSSPLAGRVTGSVEAGFDSFTEKYSIVEEDTLDRLTEFRVRAVLGYVQGSVLGDHLWLDGESSVGEENYETTGRARFTKSVGRTRLGLSGDVTHRAFRSSSAYAYANNFVRSEMQTFLSVASRPGLTFRLTDRLEWMDFEKRTEFDYDHFQNSVGITGDLAASAWTDYHGGLFYTTRSVPDSSEIRYEGYSGLFEFRRYHGIQRHSFVDVTGERRVYSDEATRSPFWSISSQASIAPLEWRRFGVSLDNTLESYVYDVDTDVYFDYIENRTAILVSYSESLDFKIGVGPTYQFLSSGFSSEDEYTEYGARLTVDVSRGGRLWASASYEPGQRDYKIDDVPGTDVVFSDYTVHRIFLYATATLAGNTAVNLFVNHEPEDHKREDDDSTLTLFSVSVIYRF